jgi:hypothetical protein
MRIRRSPPEQGSSPPFSAVIAATPPPASTTARSSGCHRGACAGAVLDEASGEVVAVQERAAAGEQGDACLERV